MFRLLSAIDSKPVKEGTVDWIVLTAGLVFLSIALTAAFTSRAPNVFDGGTAISVSVTR
ncbi:hypothetical protein [Pseudaestuariivita rosea]|uniref:hypothetical protein n=1 Tax=Pseudaestuariivita rosea TaxID=2763263 RepID=UPI001ABB7FF3|nr:hypothetical protein [Pseudaestuariivita rosea]